MDGLSRTPVRAGLILLLVAALAVGAETGWQDLEGTRIPVPPVEHPRLYLRAEHVAELPQRLKHPMLEPAVVRLREQARNSEQMRVEWDAVNYLVSRDTQLGRATIGTALRLLRDCELPDIQDGCRVTGRMMVTGAIVYDWCYELLSADEKQAFIAELVRLAKTLECGYPPAHQGSVTGHSSEAMIMRDMLSAGIAIYDEYPEMYRLAAGRIFREHLPVRNWLYNGQAYHQGDSYGPHRFSWDTYPLWIFDRLGAGNVYNPAQRFVPYLWIYTMRPDGQRLRAETPLPAVRRVAGHGAPMSARCWPPVTTAKGWCWISISGREAAAAMRPSSKYCGATWNWSLLRSTLCRCHAISVFPSVGWWPGRGGGTTASSPR